MKRLYILFAAVLSITNCYAAHLTPQQALARAIKSPQSVKALSGNMIAPQPVMTGVCENGDAAYYVFTNNSTTLFVAAEDVARPMLGYTDSGNFDPDNIPPQMQWWLDQYAKQIEWASQNGVAYTGKAYAPAGAAIAPMVETKWNQSYPYNALCPEDRGYLTVAGCVAISVSQTMKYFEWPKSEVPSVSYQWRGQTLTSPAQTFDWDNMIDDYMEGYTDTQREAVSRMIQAVGYALHTNYNLSSEGGSSAYSTDIRAALVDIFGYDAGIDYFYRDFFETDTWEQMIYDNLKNCGPVIYDGQSTIGRHSFVCDGYDGVGNFHINWGWGGKSDGYYALTALDPPSLGIGGGNGGYNYDQGAVFGVRPPAEDSKPAEPYIVCSTPLEVSLQGNMMKFGSDDSGFYNYSGVEGRISFGAEIQNTGTGDIQYATSVTIDLEPSFGIYYYTFRLPSNLINGIYRLSPCYKVNGGEWKRVMFHVGETDHINIMIKDGAITLDAEEPTDPEITVTNWTLKRGFTADESYNLTVKVSNGYTIEKEYTLEASLCTYDEDCTKVANLGTQTEYIEAFSDETMIFLGRLPDIPGGLYYLVLSADGNDVVKEAVNVEAKPSGSIETTVTDTVQPVEIYDLNGRIVSDTPAPGIYIVNGVKTVIR